MSKKRGAKGKRQTTLKNSDIDVSPKDETEEKISVIMKHFEDGLIPKNPLAAIPGTFYHGIITDSEWASLAKMVISKPDSGILVTPNYGIYLDSGLSSSCKRIEDYTIEELRTNPNFRVFTPTAGEYVMFASDLRKGYHLFETIGNESMQVSASEERDIIERSEVELDFEFWRRKISPNSASRLGCIFVATSTENIQRMFDYSSNLIILEMKIIEALKCTRVDSRWFEEYCSTHINKCIENYWSGQPFEEEVDTWEYLVDGAIKVLNLEAAKQALEYSSNSSFLDDDTWC